MIDKYCQKCGAPYQEGSVPHECPKPALTVSPFLIAQAPSLHDVDELLADIDAMLNCISMGAKFLDDIVVTHKRIREMRNKIAVAKTAMFMVGYADTGCHCAEVPFPHRHGVNGIEPLQ